MYIDRNIIYADAYKYLTCNNYIGFELPSGNKVTETNLVIDDLYIDGKFARYNDGKFVQRINPN